MATIGIAIESGSMQTVLVEPTSGEVIADRTTPLDPDAASVLTEAIDIMRAEAASLHTDVDAVGVVYRSEAERTDFLGALGDESVTLCSASASFLTWLAQSEELADAKTVLLYYMGETGVSISLADATEASFTPTKSAELDSMSPERIGSTIPLAWDVVDHSGKKPEFVALFGDSSSNRDVIDILALGLGVPVVRVGDADQIAARGAALQAREDVAGRSDVASVAPAVVPAELAAVESEPEQTVGPVEVVDPETVDPKIDAPPSVVTAASTPVVVSAVDSKPARTGGSVRKLVFAAVLLAGVLSAGVAVAATLPSDSESTAEQGVEQRDAGTDLVGATRLVDPMTATDPSVVGAQTPAIAPPPEAVPPTVDPATAAAPEPTTEPWVTQAAPRPTVVAPQPAPTKVAPPQFTVPAVVPEPGKSTEQLEQEAWDRHWQQTDEWIHQQLSGG
ncbi:hypothetical protein HQO83_24590 [Rhodococcus fascians]|nr:hypothetical protein [Rhodococcus fascians]